MIDHLVYGVLDLVAAVDDLERRFGVRAAAGGRHVGLGTHNALLALGPRTYLELIAPDPDQRTRTISLPFGLDDLSTPRLVGWAVSCHDIDAAVAGARAAGYDPGDAIEMTRATPDGATLRWRLTLNALAGGPVPFLISWAGAAHPAGAAPKGLTLESLEVAGPDPAGLAATLAALGAADVEVNRAATPALIAQLRTRDRVEVLR